MIGQTAQMLVELNLGGNFNAGLTQAEAGLGRFAGTAATSGARTGALSGAFASVGAAAGRFGGAMQHAGSQIKGLLTGPLGIIGVTGGLLTFGGAITSTISKLNDLAFGTEKLHDLTGESAQTLSVLIAATEKYGISLDKLTVTAGFYEKNIGKLEITGKLADFQKEFNVALTDGRGKAIGFADALLAVADVYTTSTDEAKNATLAASLFGRSYTGLVPVLALGRKGILELEDEAKRMGLQLSEKNVADFARYRAAIRQSQESISGLEVAIGEDLLPTITKLANGLSRFVAQNKTDIVAFFHNLVQFGKDAAKTIGGFASAVGTFWNAIPPPVRDLLTKGLIADRTVKFLFGFSPVSAVAGGLFGRFFERGSSPANPVFVSGGGIGGLPGPTGLLGGLGLGSLAAIAGLALAPVIAAEIVLALSDPKVVAAKNYVARISTATARGISPAGVPSTFDSPMANALRPGEDIRQYGQRGALDTIAGLNAYSRFAAQTALAAAGVHNFAVSAQEAATAMGYLPRRLRDQLSMTVPEIIKGIRERSAARYGGTGLGAAAVEATFQRDEIRLATKIAASTEAQAQKLADLQKIQSDLRAHGDTRAARKLDTLINTVKHQKPPSVTTIVNNRLSITGYVLSTTTRTASISSTQRFNS